MHPTHHPLLWTQPNRMFLDKWDGPCLLYLCQLLLIVTHTMGKCVGMLPTHKVMCGQAPAQSYGDVRVSTSTRECGL